MKNIELLLKVQEVIDNRNKSIEELEHNKERIEAELDDLSEKLKSREASSDFAKFKKTRSEYADLRAYLDLLEKQSIEERTVSPEKKEEIANLLRELDRSIVAVSEESFVKLKEKADEIMKMIEEDAKVQSEYYLAMEELKAVFEINNFGSSINTYSVYRLRGTSEVYKGFEFIKNK